MVSENVYNACYLSVLKFSFVRIVRGLNQLYLDIPPTSSALRMIIIVKNHLVTLLESTVVLSSPMQMNSLKDYLIDQGLLPSPVTATTEVIIEQIEQSLSEDITVLKRLERIAETSHIDRIKTVVLSGKSFIYFLTNVKTDCASFAKKL